MNITYILLYKYIIIVCYNIILIDRIQKIILDWKIHRQIEMTQLDSTPQLASKGLRKALKYASQQVV